MNLNRHRNFIIQFAYYGIIAGLFLLFCKYLLPYLMPFLMGWVIAYIFKKPIQWLMDKTNLSRGVVSIIFLCVFYAIVITVAVLVGMELVNRGIVFVGNIPSFYRQTIEPNFYQVYDQVRDFIGKLDPNVVSQFSNIMTSIISKIGETVTSLSVSTVSWLSGYITKVPMTILRTFMTIISSILIATDYRRVNTFIIRQFSEEQKNIIFEIENYLVGTVFKCIKSYGIIMAVTACELSLGLMIIGIKNPISIACGIAVLDILPVLGSGTVLIPWAIGSFITGDFWLGIKLLILYAVITAIRQVMEPRIVGTQLGLHPLVSLAGMFIGTQMFGVWGLFGTPIFLSLIVYLNKREIIHIFK